MKEICSKSFANGSVYLLHTDDGYPIEVTDTFLPFYTKDAIGRKQNKLLSNDLADRTHRWMIGVSVASGCPVKCQFCNTAKLKKTRRLTCKEIVDQVDFIVAKNSQNLHPSHSQEFKINMTRMGDWGLNEDNVRAACELLTIKYPNVHIFVSTIGIKGADYSWIKDNITLQVSLHSLDESHRNSLIPFKNKLSIEELGQIRTKSNLKTTVNLTLVDQSDFDINALKKHFDPKYFFIKISPLNKNEVSEENNLGDGVIAGNNLV